MTRQKRKTRCAAASIELLEDRVLLANIHLMDAYFTDADGNPYASVAVGQQAYIEVTFQTTDLPADASYNVYTLTGGTSYTSSVSWGAGQAGTHNYVYRAGPHLIHGGNQSIVVLLDDPSAVNETDEFDNGFFELYNGETFGPGFDKPLEGDLWVDWSIGNYVDVDLIPETDDGGPFDGECDDYHGGNFCYDGHNG